MARSLPRRANGPGHNSGPTERPFFDRLVALYENMAALREDIKAVCTEAREKDIRIMPLKQAVKDHLESNEARIAREEKQAEADRIRRAIGVLGGTPLGEAALEAVANDA